MSKQKYPEITVGGLIFNKQGKVFLMSSYKWRGKYVIPGGHVELGEKLKDTLRREVKEETGLDISDIEFINMQEFIFDNAFWKKKHFIFLDYACRAKSGKIKLNSEGQEYVWVSLKDALNLDIEPYTRKVIRDYIKKKI